MTEPISGKVASVLNSRELAINVGSNDGVKKGMQFDVLVEPKNIVDPDTGEKLGTIERVKVRVQVKNVQERLAVATTFRVKKVNVGGVNFASGHRGGFSRLLMPPKWIKKYETLKTEEKTWEALDEEESYVNTGDRVIQVIEEADSEQESAEQ